MKRSRRFLALFLAVVLVGNLMLSGVSATTPQTNSDLVFEEDFNDFYDLIDAGEATLGTALSTKTPSVKEWNGANYGNWGIYVNNASVLIQPSKTGGVDGSACVVMTPETSGRAQIRYKLPTATYNAMEAGAQYVVKADYKSVGADFKGQLELFNGNGSVITTVEFTDGQWITGEYEFTLVKGGTKDYVEVFVGIRNTAATQGALYIDNVRIEKKVQAQVPATGISINETASVEVGKTTTLTATVTPADTTDVVAWTSSDETVATVDSTGKVTGVKAGTATITIGVGSVSDTCTVTVIDNTTQTDPNLLFAESFETFADANTVITNDYTVKKGTTSWNGANPGNWTQYIAAGSVMVQPSLGNAQDGNVCLKLTPASDGRLSVVYKFSAAELAKFEDGQRYTIRVWYKSEGASFKAAMEPAMYPDWKAQSFDMTDGQWILAEHTFTMDTDNIPSNARISFGMYYGSSFSGAVYIDNITVTKEPSVDATSISINETAAVEVGKTAILASVVTPSNSTTPVNWTSSDDTVATVDSTGKVTGVKAGTVTITATAGTVSDTCTVTVTSGDGELEHISDGSFEGFANSSTVITDTLTTKGGEFEWNGATPSTGWTAYVNNGSVLMQPAVGAAHDGNVSMKLSPVNGGRMQLRYHVPKAVYDQMVDGAEYKLTVWYKGEGADFKAQMEVHNGDGSVITPVVLTNGEWIKAEYSFNLVKGGAKDYVYLFFGIAGGGGTRGSLYIDDITLERVYKALDIQLDKEEGYLEAGQTLQLTPTLFPSDARSDVVYTSSDPAVATVDDNGLVTAVKTGTATITAVAVNGKVTAKCMIHVVDEYVAVESINLNKQTLNVAPGWQEKLEASIDPANATESKIVWASSDEDVVRVDENGSILAVGTGTATITATVGGKHASCTVTVAEDAGFASTSGNVTVDFGETQTVDLSEILEGEYTVISNPAKGKLELSGSSLKYTAYTWLMEQDGQGFVDAVYTDSVKIAVKSGDTSAIITLNVTINKLEDLFFDESGNWITDVSLMFSEEQLAAIKAEARNDPNGLRAKLVQDALDKADSYMQNVPFIYSTGDSADQSEVSTGDITVHFLMAYLLTKDVAGCEEANAVYLEKTIQWVSASLSYPYWGTTTGSARNADLAAGHQLFSTAMVYHWLKDELEDVACTDKMGIDGTADTVVTTENMPILEALEKRLWFVGSELYNNSIGYNVYVMNHLHIRFTGLLAASIALRGDAQTAEERQTLIDWTGLALYKNGYGMNGLMPDGSSQEGLTYWAYGAEWLIKTPIMTELVYGIDLLETTQLYKDSADYVLYMMLSKNYWGEATNSINIGDSYNYSVHGLSQTLRIIAAVYGDSTAQWLAQEFEEQGVDPQNTPVWMSAMFADADLEAIDPIDGHLDTLKWFKDLDLVVSRSDWSGNEDLLFIKTGVPCGKNLMDMVISGEYVGNADAGHAHPDANHITLYANGEYLLRDDGYADKFASNHNTLLVDGKGQLGEGGDWMQEQPYIDTNSVPHMKIVETNDTYGFDYIVGDATQAYAASLGLDLFERNIVYLKEEQVMLVVDNIRTVTDSELELRWFPASKMVGRSGKVYIVDGEKNVMNFYPFSDEAVTSYEDVTVATRESSTKEKTFRQTYTGTNWQNAVAFSWADAGTDAPLVRYIAGENADEHCFEVNGKIYSINLATNNVTVTEGELDIPDDGSASDSTITAVLLNGEYLDGFDPSITEYEVDRWWKTYELDVDAYSNGFGATITVDYDNKTPGTITLTCVSADGTSTTVYTIRVINSQKILGIAGIETDRPRDGYSLDLIYDNLITPDTSDRRIWSNTNLPTLVFDLGQMVKLEDVIIAFNLSARRDTYFNLLVSADGVNFTSVIDDGIVEQTPGTSTPSHSEYVTVVDNANLVVRYVKINLRGQSTAGKDVASAYNSIQEITFTGTELQTVTVIGGTVADAKDYYEIGDEITVTANVPEGKKFVKWIAEGINLTDAAKQTVTFTVGSANVSLTAVFEDVVTQPSNPSNNANTSTPNGSADTSADTGDSSMLIVASIAALLSLVACLYLGNGKKTRR